MSCVRCSPCAGLTKLDDANDAGGRGSESCTLILTEGDSAKSLVIAGMSVAGRDKFGVYPLRCPAPARPLPGLSTTWHACYSHQSSCMLFQV